MMTTGGTVVKLIPLVCPQSAGAAQSVPECRQSSQAESAASCACLPIAARSARGPRLSLACDVRADLGTMAPASLTGRLLLAVLMLGDSSTGSSAFGQPAGEGHRDARVAAGTSALIVSAYVWRGFVIDDEPSLQPGAWVRVGPFTFSSFVNICLADAGNHVVNEHDLTVEYARAAGRTAIAVGLVNYYFRDPETGRHSNEVYVRSSWAVPLAPSLTVAHDLQEGSGTYLSAAASHDWPVVRSNVTIGVSAALGYNHRQWTDRSGLSDANVGVKASWRPSRSALTFAPFVSYSRSLDRDMVPSRVYGGLDLSLF